MALTAPTTQLQAGELRLSAQLQSSTVVVDALRGRTEVWSTYATVPAAMKDVPIVKDEENATVVRVVTIRHRTDVQKKQRCVIDGLTLKILAVEHPAHRRRAMLLHCAEVTT